MADEIHNGSDGRDGRDVDWGRLLAQFENINKALLKLENIPSMMTEIKLSVDGLVQTVRGHNITLHGEKDEVGVVGRLCQVEKEVKLVDDKVKQLWGALAGVVMIIVVWALNQWLGLIHP